MSENSSIPLVSVVMTVYNGSRFLREAIESILNQTFKDFEFIIVDNCSQDDSVNIIRSYKDPRILLILNGANLGQTKALNVGLRNCRGKFIARMDADDISLPQRFERQISFLQQHQDISIVGGWRQDVNVRGRFIWNYRRSTSPEVLKYYLIGSGDLTEWCMNHVVVMFRKEIFDKIGFYKEEVGAEYHYPQDYELWKRTIFHGYKLANVPEVLFKYRIVDGSESHSRYDLLLNYRKKITRDNILSYCPNMKSENIEPLVNMLEYLPQNSREEGEKVFSLFDEFFKKYCSQENTQQNQKYNQRIKSYYLPVLFKTNKSAALNWFLKILCGDPGIIFDQKFWKKIFKQFLFR